jgi:hypothetical protein
MPHNNQHHNDNDTVNNNNTKLPQERTQSEAGKSLFLKRKNRLLLTVCFSETENPPQNAISVRNKNAEWRRQWQPNIPTSKTNKKEEGIKGGGGLQQS